MCLKIMCLNLDRPYGTTELQKSKMLNMKKKKTFKLKYPIDSKKKDLLSDQ